MNPAHLETLFGFVIAEMKNFSYEEAFDRAFGRLCPLLFTEEAKSDVKSKIDSSYKAKFIRDESTSSLCAENQDWYFFTENNKHWLHYKNHLTKHKKWKKSHINSLDALSTEIVSYLANPRGESRTVKGLVVGHIQSGKTANIMAVVAKAVDAGYNNIIIMTGRSELLRKQTQDRFNRELGIAKLADFSKSNSDHANGDGWMRWTNYTHDFGIMRNLSRDPIISIVKKNANRTPVDRELGGVLGNLADHLAAEYLRNRVESDRSEIPTLIIDDECDEATPNAGGQNRDDRAVTHQAVRNLIESHALVSYVGYSATPFANVLIDREEEEDLFPRDFIVALPKPEDYIGTDDIFGVGLSSTDEEIEYYVKAGKQLGMDIIRPIDETEIKSIVNNKGNKGNKGRKEWQSLKDALKYYIVAATLQRLRKNDLCHTSMIFNVDVTVRVMENVEVRVRELLDSINPSTERNIGNKGMNSIYREAWEDLCKTAPNEAKGFSYSDITKHLTETIRLIQVRVENASENAALDTMDQLRFPELLSKGDARHYIVIGGQMISRGLTMEGLLVSYFGRNSRGYGTLIQMGRWLGYRKDYINMCRIWMTEEKKHAYRQLALVEKEMREDIRTLKKNNVKPLDFPPRIRRIEGYDVVRPELMRNVIETYRHFFSGQAIETTKFYDDQYQPTEELAEENEYDRFYSKPGDAIAENWKAYQDLIESILGKGKSAKRAADGSSMLFEGVGVTTIYKFLEAYHIHPKQVAFYDEPDRNYLIEYLDQYKNSHRKWNVVVRSVAQNMPTQLPVSFTHKVRLTSRSRDKNHRTHIEIARLMSGQDILLDMPEIYNNGSKVSTVKEMLELRAKENEDRSLLVLYPIDKDSPVPANSTDREALAQKQHLLGFGIVFSGEQRDNDRHLMAGGGKAGGDDEN